MKSTSTIYPVKVQPGKIRNGIVKCYVTWNVVEKTIDLDGGNTQMVYEHEYGWIDWVLDDVSYITRDGGKQVLTEAGKQYFVDTADEIVKWVQAAVV